MYEFLQTIMPNVVKTAPELWECFLETITMVGVSALISAAFGSVFGIFTLKTVFPFTFTSWFL